MHLQSCATEMHRLLVWRNEATTQNHPRNTVGCRFLCCVCNFSLCVQTQKIKHWWQQTLPCKNKINPQRHTSACGVSPTVSLMSHKTSWDELIELTSQSAARSSCCALLRRGYKVAQSSKQLWSLRGNEVNASRTSETSSAVHWCVLCSVEKLVMVRGTKREEFLLQSTNFHRKNPFHAWGNRLEHSTSVMLWFRGRSTDHVFLLF